MLFREKAGGGAVAVLMALGLASRSGAAEQGDVAAAQAKVLADRTLQFDATALKVSEPPSWLVSILTTVGDAIGRAIVFLDPVLRGLFWAGLALLVGGIFFFLVRELWRRRPQERPGTDAVRPVSPGIHRPSRQASPDLLQEADRLAAQGNFGEAVHVLLFRSIEDIDDHRPHHVHPALTSREIAGLGVLSAASAGALARIVANVERCRFAGLSVDEGSFAECRAAYLAFAEPGEWQR